MTSFEFWKKAYLLFGDNFNGSLENEAWQNYCGIYWDKIVEEYPGQSWGSSDNETVYAFYEGNKSELCWKFSKRFFDEMEKEIE